MPGPLVRARLFGPPLLVRGPATLAPSGRVAGRVAVALALAGGEPVPDEVLIQTAWQVPPRAAVNALQAQMSRLRVRLGSDAVLRRDHGYALATRPDLVDALSFLADVREAEQLASAGATARAAVLLQQALARVRGRPLAGLDPGAGLALWSDRLDERRRDAQEQLLECLLDGASGPVPGSDAGLVERARTLVAEDPLRERRWALLVRAHLAAGDHPAAHADLLAGETALRVGLGLDPGPRLRDLRRVLGPGRVAPPGDRGPAAPPVDRGPAAPPVAPGQDGGLPFVGRTRELDRVIGWLQTPGIRVVTVVGPAGSGSTRLAEEVASRWAAARERVDRIDLTGREDGRGVAEALAAIHGGVDPTAPAPATDPLATRRGLILVDHAPPTAAPALAALLRRAPRLRALVTARTPLGIAGERLQRLEGLPLPADDAPETLLASDAVRLLLSAAGLTTDEARGPKAAEVARLTRATDGVPLALAIAGVTVRRTGLAVSAPSRSASPGGPRSGAGGGTAALPADTGLGSVIDAACASLSAHASALLRAACLVSGSVSRGFCERFGGSTTMDRVEAELRAAAILLPAPGSGGMVRPVVADHVRAGLEPDEYRRQCRAVAAWAATCAGRDLLRPLVLPAGPEALTRLTAERDLVGSIAGWPVGLVDTGAQAAAVLVLAEIRHDPAGRRTAGAAATRLLASPELEPLDRYDLLHVLLGDAHAAGDLDLARRLSGLLVAAATPLGDAHRLLALIDSAVLRLQAGGDATLADDLDGLVHAADTAGEPRIALRGRRFAMHARSVAGLLDAAAHDAWDIMSRAGRQGARSPDSLTAVSEAVAHLAGGTRVENLPRLLAMLDAVLTAWDESTPVVRLAVGRGVLLSRLGRDPEAEESLRGVVRGLLAMAWVRGLDFALAHLAGPVARQGRRGEAARLLGASAGVAPAGLEWARLPEVEAARALLDMDADLGLRAQFDAGRRDPWAALADFGLV